MGRLAGAVVVVLIYVGGAFAQQRTLAEFDIPLLGISATVDPISPVVPKNISTAIRIVVRSGGQTLSLADARRALGDLIEAKAELSGPGLNRTITLGVSDEGQADPLLLSIPALPVAGDYSVTNIRIVAGDQPVLDVAPRNVTLKVIDQILITSVKTRALTLDEIRQKGIVLDSDDYLAFEFTLGLAQESNTVNLTLPVVFDRQGVAVPQAILPPAEPPRANVQLPSPPLPTIVPLLLQMPVDVDRPQVDLVLPSGAPVRIPAILVIPGSTGYLKQFFSAQLFVANGGPAGSGLIVRDVTGTVKLPPGADLQLGTADDPLALPEILRNGQTIVQPITMSIRAVGPDGVPDTADDVSGLNPGEQGQAEFLLRGEKEGFHELSFDINAVLEGLPVGPVPITGKAAGGVVVRNPFFDMTFTVPATTRRGEPFKVYATVTNIGQGIANDVSVTLDPTRATGARLVGDPTQHIDTLRTGDAVTLAFDFIAERTGKAVASYLHFDATGQATGELRFALGVGERNVALSPDTLVLPTALDKLPPAVVDAAMRVLGQAWSIANAPDGTLPQGVLRVSKTVATQKALAIAEAGLRATLGQSTANAVRDIAFDFYGGTPFDPGFDQLLRQTEAGHDLARQLGAALAEPASNAGGALAYERAVAQLAASGPDFVTFAIASLGANRAVDVALVDRLGKRSVPETATGIPLSQATSVVLLPLGDPASAPVLGIVATPSTGPYTLDLIGRADAAVEVAVAVPRGDGTVLHGTVSAATVTGRRQRLVLDPTDPRGVALEEDRDNNGTFETRTALVTETLTPSGPQLVSATIVGPETLNGASPFGFQVAMLFDRPVDATTAAERANYVIPHNGVQSAKKQLSGRLVFASLEQPEGPYIATQLTASGISDLRGVTGAAVTVPITSRLADPGAVVFGRVFKADGTPISSGVVTYSNNSQWTCPSTLELRGDPIVGFASTPIGPDGRYTFRFVRQDTCGYPWKMTTTDPQSGAVRTVKGFVRAAGEQIQVDIALFGRGNVTGIVRTLSGTPVPGARVVAVSQTDTQEGGTAVSDGTGRYLISGVLVGQLSVSASKDAGAGRTSVRLDRAGMTASADVTLDGGSVSLSGRVLKVEGNLTSPVAGASVVYQLTTSGPLAVVQTKADGTYAFNGMPVGSYVVSTFLDTRGKAAINGVAAAGDHLSGQDLVIVMPVATPGIPSNLGTVRGTVRFPNGAAAGDVIVTLAGRGVLSAADGQFEIANVPVQPGVNQVVNAQSRDGLRAGAAVARIDLPGDIVQGITIALSGLGSVTFTVRDAAGHPVAGQVVGLLNGCNAACGCGPRVTGADGTVRFDGLPLGVVYGKAVRSLAGFTDVSDASATITHDGEVASATLRFSGTGSVSGTVVDPDGRAAFGAFVDLQSRTFNHEACRLDQALSQSIRTGVDGTFHFASVGVGSFRVSASHPFYPTTVARTGTLTQASQDAYFLLTLANGVSTIAGELSGTIFMPDNVTPAGAGVEVTMSGGLPDVVVQTNEQGLYRFAKVFPEGRYTLTARDPVTGNLAQESVYLRAGQDAVHDVRLKGKGTVVVRVVNGAGQPIDSATVRLTENAFPNRVFEGIVDPSTLGTVTFPGVFEGSLSVVVSDAFARGGRASAVLPKAGEIVEVKVAVTTTGTVRGHFRMPDGITPIPLGTVSLVAGGRTIGQTTTEGGEDAGAFNFDFVPAGPVQVSAQDPATARTGLAGGSIVSEGDVLTLDIIAQSLGIVEGLVTSNGSSQPGANVTIDAGSFHAKTMSDADGKYRMTGVPEGRVVVTASLGQGFLAGTASATLLGEGTTLPLDVALRGSGEIAGLVTKPDGITPASTSAVAIVVGGTGGGSFSTTTAADGTFAFERVPAGLASLTARLLGSIDEGKGTVEVAAGGITPVTIRLNGVGAVAGHALDSSGAPTIGDVRLTANGAIPFTSTFHTSADGAFVFPEVPAGPFTLSLTVRTGDFSLFGTTSGTVDAEANTALNVQVQASGTVSGVVARPDGVAAAFGSEVKLVLDANRGSITLYARNDGHFEADGVPLGGFELRVRDQFTAGQALIRGRHLDANGQTVDVGTIVLDDTDVAFVSADPPDGAVQVPTNQPIRVGFSDPLASPAGVVVMNGSATLPLSASLSADQLEVILTGTLPDSKELTIKATTAVTDVFGRHLQQTVTSTFRTIDLSAPFVASVTPVASSIQVASNATVTVTFNEALGAATNLASLISVTGPAGAVQGVTALSSPNAATFTPASPLSINSIYSISVNGAVDALGHMQAVPFTATFSTIDTVSPTLALTLPTSGSFTNNAKPLIRLGVADTLSGIDFSTGTLTVDGQSVSVSPNGANIQGIPALALVDGPHAVVASIRDRAGNLGTVADSFATDIVPPSAAVLAGVIENQAVSGLLALTASAVDGASGVNQIQILSDGATIATAASPAFSVSYDTHALAEGAHTLTARATDRAGNVGPVGAAVHVFVDNVPLTVTITSPAVGTRVKDLVTVKATTSETVARVEFSVGANTVVDATAPYEVSLGLVGVPEGNATITATAFGLQGGTSLATRQVFVDRTSPPVPDVTKIFAEPPDGASSLVYGLSGAVEGGVALAITNTNTGATGSTTAAADGSFSTTIAAVAGHVLSLVAIDAAGNVSAVASVTVRSTTSLPPGAATLRFEGRLVDKVGPGLAALAPDGETDSVFTLMFSLGSNVTRQLAFIDLEGPVTRSTRGEVGSVLGVADDLGASPRNSADGRVSFPVTSTGAFTLFAASGGFLQEGATYKATAVFTNGSRYIGSVTIPSFPASEVVGASVSVVNMTMPDSAGSGDPKETVGATISLNNAALPPEALLSDPKETVGATISLNNAVLPPEAVLGDPKETVGATVSVGNGVLPAGAAASDPKEVVGSTISVANTAAQQAPLIEDVSANAPPAGQTQPLSIALGPVREGDRLLEGQTLVIGATVLGDGAVASVSFTVNGVVFAVDSTAPYTLTFTVPTTTAGLTFGATARDASNHDLSAPSIHVSTEADPLMTIVGRVVDASGNPVAGATVDVLSDGLKAEFFDFMQPLSELPSLQALAPAQVRRVTAVNMRNPDGVFGPDPYGSSLVPDYAGRFRGWITIGAPGVYTFFLGAHEGARLTIGGITVVDLPVTTGAFQQGAGAIDLPSGLVPIEVSYFEGAGSTDLQLSFQPPGGDRQVVPPSMLVPESSPYVAITNQFGVFTIRDVPTVLGNIRVRAAATVGGQGQAGMSNQVQPPDLGSVDVGDVAIAVVTP